MSRPSKTTWPEARRNDARDAVEERRLSCAIRTDQARDAPRCDAQLNVLQCMHAVEAAGEIVYFEERRGHVDVDSACAVVLRSRDRLRGEQRGHEEGRDHAARGSSSCAVNQPASCEMFIVPRRRPAQAIGMFMIEPIPRLSMSA